MHDKDKLEIKRIDPPSTEDLVKLYNAEHPDQFTHIYNIQRSTMNNPTEQQIRDEAKKEFPRSSKLKEWDTNYHEEAFIRGAQWLLSQQGEGKGMDSELEKANKIIAHLRQVRMDEGQHIVRYLKVEHDHQQKKFDELGISNDQFFEQRVNTLIFLYERLLKPEVKDNETMEEILERKRLRHKNLQSEIINQPKPEKTAEEILRSYIAYTPNSIEEQSIIEAMKEYASQSSSSLRDALIHCRNLFETLLKNSHLDDAYKDLVRIADNKAKALLTANNTQDKPNPQP